MEQFTMTVARGFGSGGKEIASRVAKRLGIHCYENRILTLASQLSGLDEELFTEVDEKLSTHGGFAAMMRGLPRARGYIARDKKFVSDDQIFSYETKIIENLADTESCVIVGKAADYVLRNHKNVVSIYIEAPRAYCVDRTMEHMEVSAGVAARTIEATDQYRAEYYKYYTGGNYWTNPINYDLTLNAERVGGSNACVDVLLDYLKRKGLISEEDIRK